jgi:ATP-dependent helicase/nuclease subunit B
MKKIEIINDDIIEKTAIKITENGDITRKIVVFPNIRAGYYLRKKILEKNKKTSLLPKIYSIDDFVKERLILNIDFEFIDSVEMLFLLYRNFRDDVSKLFSKKLMTDEFFDYAKIIINDFEELRINAIKKEDIRPYDFLIRDEIVLRDKDKKISDRYNVFSDLYSNFYDFLYSEKKFSRSMIYEKYSEVDDDLKDFNEIILAGFFALTEIEKRIFKKIYENKKSYFLFFAHPLLKEKISFLGFNLDFENDIYEGFREKNIEVLGVLNKHHQVFSLKKKLKEIGDFDNTAIIIPDTSDIIILLENFLGDVNKFNISGGFSIKYSPLFSIINDIREIFKNSVVKNYKRYFNVESFYEFISNNYLKKIVSPDFNKKIEDKTELYFDISIVKEIGTLGDIIIRFNEVRDLNDFILVFRDLINFIYEQTNLRFHPYWRFMFDEVKETLDLHLKKNFTDISFNEIYTYFDFVLEILSKINLSFISSPLEGVQCIGFLEARNLKFKNIILLDANDGVFPPLPDPNSFISDYIKKSLKIPDMRTTNDIYRYYLESLIYQAKNVFIYHIDTNQTIKSPIIEKIIWEMEKRKFQIKNFPDLLPQISFETSKPKKIKKDERIKEIIKNIDYSYTAFSTYAICEIMFYYEYVVGVSVDDESYKRFEGIDIHKSINEFLKNFKGKKMSSIDKKKVFKLIDKAVKSVFGNKNDIETRVIKKQIKKRLLDLYNFLLDKKKDSILLETEKEGETYFKVGENKFRVVARSDCIFKNSDKIEIVDFKMSSEIDRHLPKIKNISDYKKIGSLQLPLYIEVFSNYYDGVFNASIITLGTKSIQEKFLYNGDDNVSQKEFRELILKMLSDIYEKDFFEPPENQKNCKECPYKNLCFES